MITKFLLIGAVGALFVSGARAGPSLIDRTYLASVSAQADARHVDPDSRRLAFRILEEAHVAVTPGVDFGDAAEGYLRFCYAVSDATLDAALARLRAVLAP